MSKQTDIPNQIIIPSQPLTLTQNVSQPIDSNGELIAFQKFNRTRFARLLPGNQSIKNTKNWSLYSNSFRNITMGS